MKAEDNKKGINLIYSLIWRTFYSGHGAPHGAQDNGLSEGAARLLVTGLVK